MRNIFIKLTYGSIFGNNIYTIHKLVIDIRKISNNTAKFRRFIRPLCGSINCIDTEELSIIFIGIGFSFICTGKSKIKVRNLYLT